MSMINVTGLTFTYEGSYDTIFENVSFSLDTDWKLGFTGRNGRGKTTFLNLLMGKYRYSGKISATVAFDYFPFEVEDEGKQTLEIIEALLPQYEYWQLVKELNLIKVSEEVLYRSFHTLSQGERTKILLVILFLKENKFLLIDEPTNHLDMEAREAVSAYLNKKKGFILVSHDRKFLDHCIDHILSINKTNIEIQKGNFSSWWYNTELRQAFEEAENDKLKKEIKQLEVAAKRTAAWSDKIESGKNGNKISGIKADKGYIGARAADMMQRSKNLQNRQQTAIADKSKLLKNTEMSDELKISPLNYHAERLAEFHNICIAYGEKQVCKNVSFSVSRNERIMICGRNGSGKSSIIKLLCGGGIPYTGEVTVGTGVKISYVSQDTSELCGMLPAYAKAYGIDESLFKTILRKLDFPRIQFEKDMKDFSAGQKKKVLIARSLCEKAHLYIWDEPMNYIDVISRMQIENMIGEYRPTMLLVEHDASFCSHVITQKVVID